LPCLNGVCVLVPIHDLGTVHHMMKAVSDILKPIVYASHQNISSTARGKPMPRRVENGNFCFYDDAHLDLEKFVEALSQLEEEYTWLLKEEDYKAVSIVESYYVKREYQQACDKLVIALECFGQKDRGGSDEKFCCFLQHLSDMHTPLTPQLWCKNAQELLEPYRESLRIPEDHEAVYDLDKLRGFAEPILSTLQRSQSETYYGSNEEMVMRQAFCRCEDKFAKYKECALKKSAAGNFHCDMEHFFYHFAYLKEKSDSLLSLDIGKKGITYLCTHRCTQKLI